MKNASKIAVTEHKLATIIKDILQFNNMVDVKKLVNKAPPIFPALPDEHQSPISTPLPLFPNQLAKIAEHAGHPIDYKKPLIENKKQNNGVLLYPSSAA